MDDRANLEELKQEISKVAKEKLERDIRNVPNLSETDLKHRFNFHPANTEQKRKAHESVRDHCLVLALFINEKVPNGREKSLALTKLEEVMFWANAGLARDNAVH